MRRGVEEDSPMNQKVRRSMKMKISTQTNEVKAEDDYFLFFIEFLI